MRWHTLMVLAIGLFIHADSLQEDAAKKDLEQFQGNWTLISAERDGKATPQEEAKKTSLMIRANNFVLRKDSVVFSEGNFTLNPAKKPKEIDETLTVGPNKGKVFSAIYEIDVEHHRI